MLPEIVILLRQGLNLGLQEQYPRHCRSTRKLPLWIRLRHLLMRVQLKPKLQAGTALRQWLSDGFSHLDASNFISAREAFNKVTAVAPNNSAALGGLEQVAQLYDVALIRQASADALEAMEDGTWDQAINAYQRVLDLDPNLRLGRAGIANAQEHKRINAVMSAVLAQPQRLSDPRLFNDAERALAKAEALDSKPAAFADAIEGVEILLQQYREPVAVSFISDNAIDVNLSNVGNLGRFTQRTLTLRPGTYTLRGSKNGADIYANISVLPNMPPVEIFCTELLR